MAGGHERPFDASDRSREVRTDTEQPPADRARYRLMVYTLAQARFREEIAAGTTHTVAAWSATRQVAWQFDLEPPEWARLIHCLMATNG